MNKIAATIAALLTSLDAARAAHKAAIKTAENAADAAHGVAADDNAVDLDAWGEAFETKFAELNGATLRAAAAGIEAELMTQGLALAEACAKAVGRVVPSDVLAMYGEATSGRMLPTNRAKIVDHLRTVSRKHLTA